MSCGRSPLARRAGPLPEIPAAALADGFEGGAGSFRQAFRGDVVAAARRLGLTRPTLSTARKAMLCLFALVPAGVALGAAYSYQPNGQLLVFCAFYYAIRAPPSRGSAANGSLRRGRRPLPTASAQHHPSVAAGSRDEARAAALGATQKPSRSSPRRKTPPGPATARAGGWSPSAIPTRASGQGCPRGRLPLSAADHAGHTASGLPRVRGRRGSPGIELGILIGVALDALVIMRGVSRWAHLPRFAEFDGLVLRQWEVESSDEEPRSTSR